MAITPLGNSGFETGLPDTYTINAGAPTVVAAAARNGGYGLRIAYVANTPKELSVPLTAGATGKQVYRFAVRVGALPSSGDERIARAAGNQFGVFLNSAGTIGFALSSGAVRTVSGPNINDGAWHVVELQVDSSANPWTAQWKVDGTLQTAPTTLAAAGQNLSALVFGSNFNAAHVGWTCDFDDYVVGAFTTTSDWWGDGKGIKQSPGSDGTHNFTTGDFSPGDIATTQAPTWTGAWQWVANVPWTVARNAASEIAQRVGYTTNTAHYVELVPVQSSETGPANSVTGLMAYSSSGTAANTAGTIIRDGAGAVTVLWGNLNNASGGTGGTVSPFGTADYSESSNFFKSAVIAPPSGGWTTTNVNALRWRFGSSTDATPTPTLQSTMLEVDWPVATGSLLTATPSDSTTLADAVVSFDFGEGVADATSLSDATANIETKVIFPGDTTTPTDTQAFGVSATIGDTETPADATTPERGISAAVNDTETPTDGTTQETGKAVSPADTETPTDAQSFGFGPSTTDTETPTDSQSFGRGQGVADSTTPTDALFFNYSATVADATTLADQILSFAYGEGLADTETPTDQANTSGSVTITDSTTPTDAQALVRDLAQAVADSTTPTDVAAVIKFLNQTAADSTTLSDALSVAEAYNLTPADSTALSDALVTAQDYARTIADSLTSTDSLYFDHGRGIADAVTLADQQAKSIGTTLAETITIIDSSTGSLGILAALNDAVTSSDSASAVLGGAEAPYVHTHLPQSGIVSPYDAPGAVVLVVADGVITAYVADGLVTAVHDDGDLT